MQKLIIYQDEKIENNYYKSLLSFIILDYKIQLRYIFFFFINFFIL